MKKVIFVLVMAGCLVGVPLFAQRSGNLGTTTAQATLTVNTNVPAQITVNGQQIKGNVVQLPAGSYNVTATAPGYSTASVNVNLQGNQTVSLVLQPLNFALTVNTNVPAQITVNGQPIKGNVVQLPGGTYTIGASAPGYNPASLTVSLQGNQTVQVNLAAQNYSLTVATNVPAQIAVNGQPVKGNVVQLPGGSYNVTASAPGYNVASVNVTLQGNQTVSLVLQAINYSLTVATNVPANLSVNGQPIKGNAVQLPGGTYTIGASAPGYSPANVTVNLRGDQTVSLQLQPLTYTLTISTNVPANLAVNGQPIKGNTLQLVGGAYTISASAPGYRDAALSVSLQGNQTVQVNLEPATGVVAIDVPRGGITRLFVNGQAVRVSDERLVLPAGTYLIRLEHNFLAAEANVTIIPGQTVTLAPVLSLQVK